MTSIPDAVHGSRPPTGLLKGSSLFLDFDGTLVDIAPRPDAVSVSSDLRHLLERLRDRLDGRLAILTGRSAAEVERLLDPLCVAIGGHHGLETRNTGTSSSMERPPELDEIVAELRQLEREHPGVLLEDKPLAIALHYREAPDAEEVCRAAVERAAERSGLEVQPGKMVFELRPGGANKGDALRRLLDAPLFAGSKPIFLGDDLTDEPAFTAAQELGGAGVLIGERKSTAAFYRLESVGEALAWLEDACKEAQ
jgi:trehalose 6-phosphate phosphatase